MTDPYYQDEQVALHHGDAADVLTEMPDGSVNCIVTSPPYYGLRDYGEDGQIGAEQSLAEYVAALVRVMDEAHRVLADDGTMWLNLGDSYAGGGASGASSASSTLRGNGHVGGGPKQRSGAGRPASPRKKSFDGRAPKNLLGVPWRVAFALQDAGWILRSDIIWAKPSGMPESVTDRPTRSYENLFLLVKQPRYYYDAQAIADAALGGHKGSRFDAGKTAEHQLGRSKQGERADRPQLLRARELAREHDLTDAHFEAIRAVGMSDAGKAIATQSGAGRNADEVQRLASEAKRALGGYYREFLTNGKKNARDVWTIASQPFPGAHFATFPVAIPERCILAGCKPGGVVLDPFSGSGTTGLAAAKHGRRYVGIDLSREYLDLSLKTRLAQSTLDLTCAS